MQPANTSEEILSRASALQTRAPLARMVVILEATKVGRDATTRRLARELETSRRTILRDIEFMRDRLLLPIEYSAANRSFVYGGAQ